MSVLLGALAAELSWEMRVDVKLSFANGQAHAFAKSSSRTAAASVSAVLQQGIEDVAGRLERERREEALMLLLRDGGRETLSR